MADRLRSALNDSRPLLLDSAMGTRLIARGLRIDDDDPCLWNLDRPGEVLDLHRLDIIAGSDAILTNTFGANASWLGRFPGSESPDRINSAAVALAREATGLDRFVLGDLGPSGLVEPTHYLAQARILAESGVDGLILETHSPDQARLGLKLLREEFALPIFVSVFRWEPDIHRRLLDLGADAVGLNCVDLAEAIAILAPLIAADSDPVSASWLLKPSPGLADPETWARSLIELGASVVGGCCETTERHIELLDRQRKIV